MADMRLEKIFSQEPAALRTIDAQDLEDLHRQALSAGHVTMWPMERDVYTDRTDAPYTAKAFDDYLAKEAARHFPGVQRTPQVLGDFFDMAFAKAAFFHDPKRDQVLVLFPVYDKPSGTPAAFFMVLVPTTRAARMIEEVINVNCQALYKTHEEPEKLCEGRTADMIAARRRMIEKTVQVFETVTGQEVHDPIRHFTRRVIQTELAALDNNIAVPAFARDFEQEADSAGGRQAQGKDKKRAAGKVSDEAKKIATAKRRDDAKNWIFRN